MESIASRMAAALGIVVAAASGAWIHLAIGKHVATPIAAADDARVPRAVAVEPNFDFGRAHQGNPVEHVFKVRNKGFGELIIERAQGS